VAWSAGAFAAGLFLAGQEAFPPGWTAGLCAVAALAVGWRAPKSQWKAPLVVSLAFVAAGLAHGLARAPAQWGDPLSRYLAEHPEARCDFVGRVRAAPLPRPGLDYGQVVVDVRQVTHLGETRALPGGLLLRWQDPEGVVYPGMVIAIRGTPTLRLAPVNHGMTGPEEHYHRRGVFSALTVRGDAVEVLDVETGSFGYWAGQLRLAQARLLADVLPREVMPFIYTIWLGERGQLSGERYADFLATGTAHILAVSGIHVGIVYFSVVFLLLGFGVPRRMRVVLAMLAVILFTVAAGARLSTLRAATMLLLALTAELFNREPDPPTGLGLAAWVLLLWDPDNLFDPGFLLSFTSVASLMLFTRPLTPAGIPMPRGMREALGTVFGVQVLPLPLAAHLFHVFSYAAPVANLIIVPVLGMVLWLCLGATLTALIVPPVAVLFGYGLLPLVAFIEWTAETIGGWAWSSRAVSSPTVWGVLAYYAAVAALLRAWKVPEARRRSLAAAAVAAGLTVLVWTPLRPAPGVDFLDVGHGDAIVVRTPENDILLKDGGDAFGFHDYGRRVVAPYLHSQGITEIDFVAVSHPHLDHIGGLFHIIDTFPVGEVWLAPPSGVPVESELVRQCADRGIPVRRLERGMALERGSTTFSVLHPPGDWNMGASLNEGSLVLEVAWPGMTMLLTGDIEEAGEAAVEDFVSPVRVLKAPHHGSMTSSSPAFLDATAPAVAVMTTAGPRGRSPLRLEILDRYARRDIEVWRTDLHGGVRIRLDEDALEITPARRRPLAGAGRGH